MICLQVFRDHAVEHLHLAAAAFVIFHKHVGIHANLAQPGQIRQDIERLPSFFQLFSGIASHGFIDLPLFIGHIRGQNPLILGRQIFQHILLDPPQDKRRGFTGDHGSIAFFELRKLLEIPWHDIVEYAPEIHHAVLDGRSCQGKSVSDLQFFYGTGLLRMDIFDILRFIQDSIVEFTCILADIIPQRIVGSDIDRLLPIADAGDDLAAPAVGTVDSGYSGRRVEAGEFADPVEDQALRADHKTGLSCTVGTDQRDYLNGFAKTHIVRQDTSHAVSGKDRHPSVSIRLIPPQFSVQVRQ